MQVKALLTSFAGAGRSLFPPAGMKLPRPRRLGWFWSVVLLGLVLWILFMMRVYYIATQDPGGEAAKIAAECRERRDPTAGIPKIIHQIWNDENVPDKWKPAVRSCREKNPGYEYKLWTMKDIEELVRKDYNWFTPTFTGYEYLMQKGDSARYVILHKYGGIYLDLDITCIVSMDTALTGIDLETTDLVAGDAPGPGVMDTPIIMSKKGNPFMEFCMRKLAVMNHNYILPFLTVFFSTGPYYLSMTYLQFPCKDTINRLEVPVMRNLYFVHEHAASWQSWDYYIIKFFEIYFIPIFIVILLVKILSPRRTIIKKIFVWTPKVSVQ